MIVTRNKKIVFSLVWGFLFGLYIAINLLINKIPYLTNHDYVFISTIGLFLFIFLSSYWFIFGSIAEKALKYKPFLNRTRQVVSTGLAILLGIFVSVILHFLFYKWLIPTPYLDVKLIFVDGDIKLNSIKVNQISGEVKNVLFEDLSYDNLEAWEISKINIRPTREFSDFKFSTETADEIAFTFTEQSHGLVQLWINGRPQFFVIENGSEITQPISFWGELYRIQVVFIFGFYLICSAFYGMNFYAFFVLEKQLGGVLGGMAQYVGVNIFSFLILVLILPLSSYFPLPFIGKYGKHHVCNSIETCQWMAIDDILPFWLLIGGFILIVFLFLSFLKSKKKNMIFITIALILTIVGFFRLYKTSVSADRWIDAGAYSLSQIYVEYPYYDVMGFINAEFPDKKMIVSEDLYEKAFYALNYEFFYIYEGGMGIVPASEITLSTQAANQLLSAKHKLFSYPNTDLYFIYPQTDHDDVFQFVAQYLDNGDIIIYPEYSTGDS